MKIVPGPSRCLGLAVTVACLVLAGCASGEQGSSPGTAPAQQASPSGTAASPAAASPTPSPAPSPLSGEELRVLLPTPADLGKGWRVEARKVKGLDESDPEYQDYSPECLDFAKFWFGRAISKDDPNAAYVELSKGKDFGERSVTVRIEPMPTEGWDAYRTSAATLVEECPSLSIASTGPNSLPATWLNEPFEVPGAEDAVAFSGTVNAFIAQVYLFGAILPAGEQVVTVTTTWTQKSKKEFSRVLQLARDKVTTAAGVPAPSAAADVVPSPSAS